MDIVQFLSSINLLSIVAFVGITCFLIFEVVQLRKERLQKAKPTVPQFNPSTLTQSLEQKSVVVKQAEGSAKKTSHQLLVWMMAIAVVIFGGFIGFYIYLSKAPKVVENNNSQVQIQEIQSGGIKLYGPDWKELKSADLLVLKGGDTIIGAIQTIKGSDIDSARIRLNKDEWSQNDITTQFNNSYNVFYKEFTIATGDARLRVEAQLHSAKDGWLGE